MMILLIFYKNLNKKSIKKLIFRLSVSDVTQRVSEILVGNDDLIKRFEIFLPEEKQDKQPVASQLPAIAYQFVNTVRERFSKTNPEVYNDFLKILKQFKDNKISINEVTIKIASLFEGNEDLQSQFKLFLPTTQNNINPPPYEMRSKNIIQNIHHEKEIEEKKKIKLSPSSSPSESGKRKKRHENAAVFYIKFSMKYQIYLKERKHSLKMLEHI